MSDYNEMRTYGVDEDNTVVRREVGKEAVDHPQHYGGADNPYEAIKIIEALDLGFCLGNALKYLVRAGHKYPDKKNEDLQKAVWYIQREMGKK